VCQRTFYRSKCGPWRNRNRDIPKSIWPRDCPMHATIVHVDAWMVSYRSDYHDFWAVEGLVLSSLGYMRCFVHNRLRATESDQLSEWSNTNQDHLRITPNWINWIKEELLKSHVTATIQHKSTCSIPSLINDGTHVCTTMVITHVYHVYIIYQHHLQAWVR
jgi:hypothetical protein